jgi:hypothetical protein
MRRYNEKRCSEICPETKGSSQQRIYFLHFSGQNSVSSPQFHHLLENNKLMRGRVVLLHPLYLTQETNKESPLSRRAFFFAIKILPISRADAGFYPMQPQLTLCLRGF